MLFALGLTLTTLVSPVSAAPQTQLGSGPARIERRLPIVPNGPSSVSIGAHSPASSVFGQSVTFNYTVNAGGGAMPTCSDTSGGTINLVEGGTVASATTPTAITTAGLSTGFHVFTFNYLGNANCAGSSSAGFGYTVNRANTTTSLSSSLNPSARFQSVTFTAVVNVVAPGAGTRTGTVSFRDGTTVIGTGSVIGGVATFTTSNLSVGLHNITADYGGDGNFNGSTSNTIAQTVTRLATSISLSSTPNSSRCGQSVTFTATVSPSGASGTVSFDDGADHLATRTVVGGVATFSTTWLEVGTHLVRATYEGDVDYNPSTSTDIDQVVIKTNTTVSLSRNPNASTVYGEYVEFVAQLAAVGPGAGTPSGFVLFEDNGNTIGVGFIDGTGKATFTTSSLDVGSHPITAVYGGDDCFNGSTSGTINHTVNKADTTVTLSRFSDCGTANPSRFGQKVFFTAVVEAVAPGGGIPVGSVTFKDGATILDTLSLGSDGSVTYATQSLPVGGHTITGTYNGSVNYNTSVSGGMGHTVNKADTSVTITDPGAGGAVYVFGQGFLLKATVSVLPCGQRGPWGVPTGKVRFTFSPAVTFNGQPYLETDVGGDGSVFASVPLPDFPNVGGYTVTAQYIGDANFNASAASAGRTIIILPAATNVTVITSLSPAVFGQAVDFTVTVAVNTPGSNIPGTTNPLKVTTGNIILTLTPTVGAPIILGGSLTLTPGQPFTGLVTIPAGILPVGTYNVQAQYVPTTFNFLPSVSPLYMGAANVPQIVVKANTATSINSSLNPAPAGGAVTLTASLLVVSPGAGTPTGTVAFKKGGVDIPGCAAVALVGLGATCNTSFSPPGTYLLTAVYSGDGNFNGSTSGGLNQVVVINPTTLSLVDTSVPLVTNFGQTASFKATIAPAAATGSVTFKRAGIDIAGCVNVPLAGAMASCSTAALPAGDNPISAVYTPTGDFTGSTSNVVFHTVNKAPTTTTLTRTPNANTVCGEPITFKATVTSGAGTPTGTVIFKADGIDFGSAPLVGGMASVTVANLAVGPRVITAVYLGDTNFAISTSANLNHTVSQGAATVALLSSANPSVTGQSVTFTATVSPVAPSTGTPTGMVNFKENGVLIGSATLNPAGVASFSFAMLSPGVRTITAEYVGSGCHAMAVGTLTQTVNKANTTVTVTASPSPSIFGMPVTFTATVAAVAPGGGTPTGTVTFKDGAANIAGCIGVALVGGQATCTTSALAVGVHTINADYSGSAAYNLSTGSMSHTVSDTPVDLRVLKTSSPNPVQAGLDLTYIITVTNPSTVAAQATLVDPLPPEVTFVSVTPAGGWACAGTTTVTCSTAALAAMSSAVIRIVVHVPDTLPAGTLLRNTATVSSSSNPDPNPLDNVSRNETTVYRFRRPF